MQAELKKRGLLGKVNGADHTTSRAKADQSDDWRPIMPVPDGTAEPALTHPAYGKPSRVWTYPDAGGRVLFQAGRAIIRRPRRPVQQRFISCSSA